MHHALEIQDILLVIFDHCPHPTARRRSWRDGSTLTSLARTCRTFKEPALDVLWEILCDLSPLARCVPDASHQKGEGAYAFSRSLTQTEWDTLQGYTRRIRGIQDFSYGLDWDSVATFLNPPTATPLFPSLHTLYCDCREDNKDLLHHPLPSLAFLHVTFEHPHLLRNSFKLFPRFSPNIRKLSLYVDNMDGIPIFGNIDPNYVCRWQNLTSVQCCQVTLDAHDLVHLSRMHALTRLSFATTTTLSPFDSPLLFSNLRDLELRSEALKTTSWLLSQIRLPAISEFHAVVFYCPSRLQLGSFWASFRIANAGRTTERLRLTHSCRLSHNFARPQEALVLGFDDLQLCMAFSNLRSMNIDIGWNVGLTDSDLVTLVSAWSDLESLSINTIWGWNTAGGITPSGLARLVQKCQSLGFVALAIDTRDYTESVRLQESIELTSPHRRPLSIHVLGSMIQEECVPVMANFFASIVPRVSCYLSTQDAAGLAGPNWETYRTRWEDVHRRVRGYEDS